MLSKIVFITCFTHLDLLDLLKLTLKNYFMRNRLLIVSLLMATLFQQSIVAQDEYKFGKVTEEELKMTHYEPDTSATAVYLYMMGDTKFTYSSTVGEFGTETNYAYRIKILKSEGKKYADVTIPFYVNNASGGTRERIESIKATSYTLVDGKVVESDLSKKYIFEEKGSGNWRVMKFSIPNVEEGSVIEYKYTQTSNDAFHLDPWTIQGGLPVQYAKYEVQIPEYFHYKSEMKGYDQILTEQDKSTVGFNVGVNTFGQANVYCKDYIFIAKDIPAVKDESYLWCIDDYLTGIEFELDGIQNPGGSFKSYASNWEMVKNTLRKYEHFGGMMDFKNPYQEEMRAKQVSQLPFEEKIRAVLSILKDKIKWNGEYALYEDDIEESIKQGSASNANLNFILMSMLRDAGIQYTPILLRTRPNGRLPFRATVDKLNTFIIAAYTSDGKPYYLDGSIEYGDLNILSPSLMVQRAIVFDDAIQTNFVDLSTIGRNSTAHNSNVTIHPDGTFEGTRQTIYAGQSAVNFKRRMANEKDSIEAIQKTEEEYNIRISECKTHKTKGMGARCNEQIAFTGELLTSDDHIYLNPMIFPDETETPFTDASRKFPVEFPYAQTVSVNTTLTLPEGYQVEELPQNSRGVMNHNELEFSYIARQVDNKVTIQYKATVNTPFIAPAQYEELRGFWEEMVNRNNQQLVLKKIASQP